MSYNLLEEKWIPVLMNDGKVSRVGIKEALTQAGRIRQIAASNPMDRVAILRFLLAILYWCKGNPPDNYETISGDSFPPDWFTKLDVNKDYFNLLGEGKRFYQDRAARRNRTTTELIQEIPTGNNFWHFRHSTDYTNGLCPACCAMGLLRLPLFSVSGLPDLKSGINGTPPVYVVPGCITLRDTLCTNWVSHAQLGEPAWVHSANHPTAGAVVPLLMGLTLLSRRVWLHDPSAPQGSCIGCGTKEEGLIRTCEFQNSGEKKNEQWDDPHVIYFDKVPRKAVKAPDLTATGRFKMDRPWPDLLVGIVKGGKFGFANNPTSLLIVGFATDKAKNIDVWERTIHIPPTQSIQDTTLSLIQLWQKEGLRLEKRLSRSKIEGSAIIATIRPHVEGKVSAKATELISGNDKSWEQAAREYRPMMDVIAKSLSPGFTTAAVERRQSIKKIMPYMRPKTETVKKSGRKKGGNK